MRSDVQSHCLVYGSTPLSSPESEILDIVRVSESRNATLGCSGILLYGHEGYFQVIEGPLAAVEELFACIKIDRRHRVIWHEFSGPSRRRISAVLPMGYLDRSEFCKTGLKIPDMFMPIADVSNAILKVAAQKYPSAMI